MTSDEFQVRKEKREALRAAGISPYPYRYDPTHSVRAFLDAFDSLGEATVRLAGRVVVKRVFGKLIFARIRDASGEVQIVLERGFTGDPHPEQPAVKFFKKFVDLGDFVGVEGVAFRTRKGEPSLRVSRYTLLAKGLRPLPEKWHGLKDPQTRYRQRYLDLIANPERWQVYRTRARIIRFLRSYLDERGFLEVETPVLQPVYGGAAARPFETFAHALGVKLYLRIADELYLKRLLVGGAERVYEISKDFRNEGIDRTHYPEFTMLEAYAAYWDYTDWMREVEQMLCGLVQELYGTSTLEAGEQVVDFSPPFARIRMLDALQEALGVDPLEIPAPRLRDVLEEKGVQVASGTPRHKMLDKAFDQLIGRHLHNPTFVLDHPRILSPLAKEHREDPRLTERFELFILGMEVANAFSELNDPVDQRARMEAQLALRDADSEIPREIDEDFLTALEYGMPPTGGIGIGVDRLVMILTGESSIRDVMLFPQLKPREQARKEERNT